MSNFETFFMSFLFPILIAMVIDYAVLKKIGKERASNNTEAKET